MLTYSIEKIAPSALTSVDFSAAQVAELRYIRPESKTAKPRINAQLLHDGASFYLHFSVQNDPAVKIVHTGFQQRVCEDSCCECFLLPVAGKGYFNFECNAGGALLANYVEDPTREPGGPLAKATPLAEDAMRKIEVLHTLPSVMPEERADIAWELRLKIPFSIMEFYTGKLESEGRLNFYHCADGTTLPRWFAWSPVNELNFHLPNCFGKYMLKNS